MQISVSVSICPGASYVIIPLFRNKWFMLDEMTSSEMLLYFHYSRTRTDSSILKVPPLAGRISRGKQKNQQILSKF